MNFSDSFFKETSLDVLSFNCSELSSPGLPKATSSPNKETKLKPDKNEHKKKIGNQVHKPIKIININFQSICNKKKSDLLEIINSVKPDIIIGTETWLDKSIPSTDLLSK